MHDSCLHVLKDIPCKGALDFISVAPERRNGTKEWSPQEQVSSQKLGSIFLNSLSC